MKILYLTDQIYLHGGIEKVLSQKANYLAEVTGDEVMIVTHNQQGRMPVYSFSEKIHMSDLGINYEITKSYLHPANLKKVLPHKNALIKILKKLKPDIVISCSFGPDFYFIPSLKKQIPKIKEFHSSRYFTNQSSGSLKVKILEWLTAAAEKKYHQLVVLNEDERGFYESTKISVIPNPVELSLFAVTANEKKILAAGRLSPVKNFEDLIEIFAEVYKDFPDWELHFWGEDYVDTQEKLQEKINFKGLNHCIKFMGMTDNLKKEMLNYSIYALTSRTECFPMVLLEALSMGLPVVSYNSPTGPRHILTNESDSFVVPYKNLDIFTEKLKHMMRNEGIRQEMGKKAIENIRRFSMDKVMPLWTDLFNKLIS